MDLLHNEFITDPLLLSVLDSAAEARRQSLEILQLIAEYRSHTSPPEDANLLQLSKQQKHLSAHLAQLRGLNRRAILGVRRTKAETAEARQEIDTLHLQLQNLYYEQRHLRGEIHACRDYDHTYEEIRMVPADEFLARHPELADAPEHDLTVARIRDEHAQRVALEEQRQALLKRKEELLKETTAKKEELAKVDLEAERWMAASHGMRKLLEAHEKQVAAARDLD